MSCLRNHWQIAGVGVRTSDVARKGHGGQLPKTNSVEKNLRLMYPRMSQLGVFKTKKVLLAWLAAIVLYPIFIVVDLSVIAMVSCVW